VRVFNSGQAFLTGDAQNDPGVISSYARLWRIHSLMAVPLKLEGRAIGVLRVGSFKRNSFSPEHLEFVSTIAGEVAILVETALLNRRLSEATEQLRAANRMKDEFVSTVSHEFKTPLTTIMGFLSVMIQGEAGALTDQQVRFLTVASNAAKRLAFLVSELLDLSRLEGGTPMDLRELDLGRIVRQSLEAHAPQARERSLDLSWDVPDFLPRVMGDERWLGLVIDNLLSNAIKFSRSGGRVRVLLAGQEEDLRFSVADEGIGIPPEDSRHIFQKFYRAGNTHEIGASGTGLGLAISREVIARHGGRVWFESEVGRGSTFFFALPAVSRSEALSLR